MQIRLDVPASKAACLIALVAGMAMASVQAQTPAFDDHVIDLPFQSLFALPIGSRGLEIGPAAQRADGRLVRMRGFMVAREQPVPGLFLLAPRPVRLSEHADGDATDLPAAVVTVVLAPQQSDRVVVHEPGPIELVGTLRIGRQEDPRGAVSWFRILLVPEAMAAVPSTQPATGDRRTH